MPMSPCSSFSSNTSFMFLGLLSSTAKHVVEIQHIKEIVSTICITLFITSLLHITQRKILYAKYTTDRSSDLNNWSWGKDLVTSLAELAA